MTRFSWFVSSVIGFSLGNFLVGFEPGLVFGFIVGCLTAWAFIPDRNLEDRT